MEKYRANLPSDIFSDFWLVRTKWTPEKVVLFGPLEECSDAVQTTTQKAATHTHTKLFLHSWVAFHRSIY